MTIQRIREFAPGDRYLYDFKLLTYAKGWCQADTRQDASYYGNWIQPDTKELFCYCEGDVTLVRCETDDEFVASVREMAAWQKEHGYWLGIDPGLTPEMKTKFTDLGLGDLFHPSASEAPEQSAHH